jgi:hypothetical protein
LHKANHCSATSSDLTDHCGDLQLTFIHQSETSQQCTREARKIDEAHLTHFTSYTDLTPTNADTSHSVTRVGVSDGGGGVSATGKSGYMDRSGESGVDRVDAAGDDERGDDMTTGADHIGASSETTM